MKSLRTQSWITILVLLCIVVTVKTMASPITWQQAQQNALAFMQERGKSIAVSSLCHAPMRAASVDEPQPYYVFNIGNNQGYVIAGGDNYAYPVLGYSDEGFIDVNNIPCNLQAWLDGYSRQIKCLQEHGASASRSPQKNNERPAIVPMLTTKWGQGDPYNMYCPIDPRNGKQCATGCVATAMAQVMYYHRAHSVNQTTQEIPAYTTPRLGINVDLIPSGSFIDWNNMKNKYYTATEVQKQAVANLMKYCGSAVKMDYSFAGSGASSSVAARAFPKYFNFSSKTRLVHRSASDEEWETLIYNELYNGRPVCYGGSDGNQGHAFVCDGYDGVGYYHFNWGWENGAFASSPDGYFVLTVNDSTDLLLPYSSGQEVIINAEPRVSMPDPEAGIHFADPETKLQCLLNWDENDDGALSLDEAVSVSDISRAFRFTDITSFDEFKHFTNVTTIGEDAFRYCFHLMNFTIPNFVTSIGCNAFSRCTSLTSVTFGNSLATIDNNAFSDCTGLTSVDIPNSVTSIGNYAFYDCSNLTNVTLGNSVITIGESAFYNCSALSRIDIPNSVTTIGSGAFSDCDNLKEFTWNANNCPSFYCPSSVEHLTFGDEIEVIPDQFASGCSGLTNVTVSNSVIKIGFHAFYYCLGLKSLSIPSSVTTIGGWAFSGCNGLKSVTIPSTVTSLGEAAFSDCNGLTSMTIYTDNVSSSAFAYCDNLESVTLGKSVKSIAPYAFYGSENVNTVTCLALNPPSLSATSFAYDYDHQLFKVSTLRVPVDVVDTYKSTWPWSQFPNIVGIDPSMGDVNLDGEVNIADVNVIVDDILANSNEYMSDVNRDGEVNIADINTLIDKILNYQ